MPAQSTGSSVCLWPSSACLVSELAEDLVRLSANELQDTVIALPTRRLATWTIAMISRRRQAFFPPRFFNFDEFVAAFTQDHAAAVVLSDLDEELILAALLRHGDFRHLRLGHEHEIRQFFSEIVAWNLDTHAFDKLHTALEEDFAHCEQSIETLHERVFELERLHGQFLETLKASGATTAVRERRRRSESLAERLEGGETLVASKVYLVGFSSRTSSDQRLLVQLARQPNVSIWLNEPPELFGTQNPLAMLLDFLEAPAQRRSCTIQVKKPQTPVTIHRTPTVMAEVACALDMAGKAIEDGCPPSQIAILVTNDQAYGKPLRSMVARLGLEANLAIGTPLSHTRLGSWFATLLDLIQGGQSTADILSFLSHPLTRRWLSGRLPHRLARGIDLTPAYLGQVIPEQICSSGVTSGLAVLASSPDLGDEAKEACRVARETLSVFLGKGDGDSSPSHQRTLESWIHSFCLVVEEFGVLAETAPSGNPRDQSVERSALAATGRFLASLRTMSGRQWHMDAPLSRLEFTSLVREKLLPLDVRSVGDPLCGVQILSVSEARYVPFRLVILLGCTEGQFPQALPQDHILDNSLKTRIGLPGWQLREAIEDTTFHLLKGRLPRMAIFYPQLLGRDPAVRSRFVERLEAHGEAKTFTHDGDDEQLLCFGDRRKTMPPVELEARLGRQGRLGDRLATYRETLSHSISASALERLIRCPYQFLLARLGLKPLEIPEEGEARQEGDWLHAVLEAFFTGETGGRQVAPPLDGRVPWEEFPDHALKRLIHLSDILAPAHIKGSPLFLHVRYKSWPAFVRHLMTLYGPDRLTYMSRGLREFPIGDARERQAVQLTFGDRTMRLTGSVDSLDDLGDIFVLTDYKRNAVPSKSDVKTGKAPQLTLYANALAHLPMERQLDEDDGRPAYPLERMVMGYYSVIKGQWNGVAAGQDALPRAQELGLLKGRDSLEDMTAALTAIWDWRHCEVFGEDGHFQPDQSDCGFCDFEGVCRKNDPQISSAWQHPERLRDYLQRLKEQLNATKAKTSEAGKSKSRHQGDTRHQLQQPCPRPRRHQRIEENLQ